jgi:hypothetical protein
MRAKMSRLFPPGRDKALDRCTVRGNEKKSIKQWGKP